jgi:hypothetical protein
VNSARVFAAVVLLKRRIEHPALEQHRSARSPDLTIADNLAAQSIGRVLD